MALPVGQPVPDFTLPSSEGGLITLSDWLSRGPVVLGTVRLAFTGG
jgi:peroxiredoxin